MKIIRENRKKNILPSFLPSDHYCSSFVTFPYSHFLMCKKFWIRVASSLPFLKSCYFPPIGYKLVDPVFSIWHYNTSIFFSLNNSRGGFSDFYIYVSKIMALLRYIHTQYSLLILSVQFNGS